MATIEDALRAKITTLAAVVAISPTIRPEKPAQKDTLPLTVISVEEEDHLNDLTGKGGLVDATVDIMAVAETKTAARALSESLRVNGTEPGTGLASFEGTVSGVEIQSCTLEQSKFEFVPYAEGSDEGFYIQHNFYQVFYSEAV